MSSTSSISVIFLGTGGSTSLPTLDCTLKPAKSCLACLTALQPGGERNIRGQSSAVVQVTLKHGDVKNFIIDFGVTNIAKAALQMRQRGVNKIDGVFITHDHQDAMSGVPNLATLTLQGWSQDHVDLFSTDRTLSIIKERFSFCFENASKFRLHALVEHETIEVAGVPCTAFPVQHGEADGQPYHSLGFIFDQALLYISDANNIPSRSWQTIEGTLTSPPAIAVLEQLRTQGLPGHFGLAQAISAASRIGAAKTYFTQISHGQTHEQLVKCCQAIEPGNNPKQSQLQHGSLPGASRFNGNYQAYFKSKPCYARPDRFHYPLARILELDERDDAVVVEVALQEIEEWLGHVPSIWSRPAFDGLSIHATRSDSDWVVQDDAYYNIGSPRNASRALSDSLQMDY